MTIRELGLKVLNFIIRHPRVLTGIGPSPITRGGIRTAYNSQNSVTTFDADLIAGIRLLDSAYNSMTDPEVQTLIDESIGVDEDIADALNEALGSSGGDN